MRLLGRRAECEFLDAALTSGAQGSSQVVVLRGDAGAGKSALLDYTVGRADGWRVAKAAGVESEMELAYSGLHQLCAPMLAHLDSLPDPQRGALATVFGVEAGPAPDRFLVGLATLTLLAEVADEQPLLCVIDDAHWLDAASAQIVLFVCRRLLAERVVILSAARTGIGDDVFAGLPHLTVPPLNDSDARELLLSVVHGPLDVAVLDQLVTESHGNPLALQELSRTGAKPGLAGGFGVLDGRPVVGKVEQSYALRLAGLPQPTRLLVLAAAAEPLGDPVLLNRAAEHLGIDFAAIGPAVDEGLVDVRARVEFAHPLARSAVYRTATAADRQSVHRALAEATDPGIDPDRRAWHRAQATAAPDENVADELEQSADRAQARGGIAAAAAFLDRAVSLTVDPARRAERALLAAQASAHAGEFDAALGLLATADSGPLDDAQRARADLLRGQIGFASGLGNDIPRSLMTAARALEPLDIDLARETYLSAWNAVCEVGDLSEKDLLSEIALSVRALSSTADPPRPIDVLLDGLAILTTEGFAPAVPTLERAYEMLMTLSVEDILRWGGATTTAGIGLWDIEGQYAMSTRYVDLVRTAGALSELTLYLSRAAIACMRMGELGQAGMLIAEGEDIATAIGSRFAQSTRMRLLAMQGRETETLAAIEAAVPTLAGTNKGRAHWATAILCNGLGRYEEAAVAARRASSIIFPTPSRFALAELVEAAARTGDVELAGTSLEQLIEITRPAKNNAALGIEARCRALLNDGAAAEDDYLEAIERLARTRLRPDLARAHLLYGEWLRREGRRVDAREQLRIAHDMLATIGMEAFAERARRELNATGETVRKRIDETRGQLTPQETQIAQLARDGLTNREIGAQLFLSERTVEWHMRKVLAKLGIKSRRQLRAALSELGAVHTLR
jgi:DNA-binding CsgD family transcriptional regulator